MVVDIDENARCTSLLSMQIAMLVYLIRMVNLTDKMLFSNHLRHSLSWNKYWYRTIDQ